MNAGIVRSPHAADNPEPLHVLHVVEADSLIRLGPMIRALSDRLRADAITSAVLTDEPDIAGEVLANPEMMVVPTLEGWRAWTLGRALRSRPGPPPQLLCLWTLRGFPAISRWAESINAPLVVYVSSHGVARRVHRPMIQPRHTFVAATEALRAAIETRLRQELDVIDVIGPVLPIPDWQGPVAAPRSRLPAIVWHGPLSDHAGLTVLVDAVQQLDRQEREFQVVLVGRGASRQPLWRMLRQRGIEHRVSVIDAPQFAELAIEGADVLVVPASEDETSIVPLLAMARGVYVVASRDQSSEWFIDDETSLQFAPGSAKELAYQLTRILEGRQEVEGLLNSARAYVSDHHDADAFAPVFENVLRAARRAGVAEPAESRG